MSFNPEVRPDLVDRWLTKHPEDASKSLDSKELQKLGSSACGFREKITVFFKEKDPAAWYREKGEKLIEDHNTNIIKVKISKEPYNLSEQKITKVKNFLQDHHSIPADRVLSESSNQGDPLFKKLNLILEFENQLDKPWFEGMMSDQQIDQMLNTDSPENTNKMWTIVEVGKTIEQFKVDPYVAESMIKNIALPADFDDRSVAGIKELIKTIDQSKVSPDMAKSIIGSIATPGNFDDQSIAVIKELMTLTGKVHRSEIGKIMDISEVLFHNAENEPTTPQFLKDVGNSNGLRQSVRQLDPALIKDPLFASAMRNLIQDWQPLLSLPDDRFGSWMQAQTITKVEDLFALPDNFHDSQIKQLEDMGASKFADYVRDFTDAVQIEEVIKVCSSTKKQLEAAGLPHLFKRWVEGGEDTEVRAITYASEITKAVERYDSLSEGDKFRSFMRDPEHAGKGPTQAQKDFNSMQWNEVKKGFSAPIQQEVEATLADGKHYKEVESVQRELQLEKDYKATIKTTSKFDRLKQVFGADELTNVVQGAVEEGGEAGEKAVINLASMRATYHRYGLDKQFVEKANAFFKKEEIKSLSNTEKVERFLATEAGSEVRKLDQIRATFFEQPGMRQLYDSSTARFLTLKSPQEVVQRYSQTIPDEMNQIKDLQDQLVDRLTPPGATEDVRESIRATVQKNTEDALGRSIENKPLARAL